jgi:6-oxo-cyclohex-1-ene-carbonyl-CoA hydrolase
MMTEAHAGFRAFNEGPRDRREIDFIDLRRRLAAGETWGPGLIDAIQPRETAEARR